MRILVIEDDPTDLKLFRVVLEGSGHIVRERTSAEGAVDAAIADSPELILLDLRLPGMTGWELTRELKKNPRTRAIPVVAISAFADCFPREELLKIGCEAVILKPV